MDLNHLENLQDLQDALASSTEKTVVLFKHSTRCPVSHTANKVYLDHVYDHGESDVLYTFLDLINHRDVSNAIARALNVPHQSPQVIVVRDKEAVWHASHFDITADALAEALNHQE